MPVDTGTGASIAFGTSSFTANVMSIAGNDMTRSDIDTSHLGTTTNRTFVPGDLVDNGTVELEIQFNPDNQPPITGASETITITFPLGSGGTTAASAAFTGYVNSWSYNVPLEELMTATITIKVSGAITWTDQS